MCGVSCVSKYDCLRGVHSLIPFRIFVSLLLLYLLLLSQIVMDRDFGTNPLSLQNTAMSRLAKAGEIVGSEGLHDKELRELATLARTLKDENIRLSKQLLSHKKEAGVADLQKGRKKFDQEKFERGSASLRHSTKKKFDQQAADVASLGGGETKEMEMSTAITGSMLKPRSFRIDDTDEVGEVHGTVPNPLHRSKSFKSGSASSRRFIQKQEEERTLSVQEQEDERDRDIAHMML